MWCVDVSGSGLCLVRNISGVNLQAVPLDYYQLLSVTLQELVFYFLLFLLLVCFRYLNEIGDHFLRKSNESIQLFGCDISYNAEEAVFVHSPFWDVHHSNISEITVMINNSLITDNGRGIFQFSRYVIFFLKSLYSLKIFKGKKLL